MSWSGVAGLWLFASGLTAVFVTQLLWTGGVGRADTAPMGVQRYLVIAWLLALGGAFFFSSSNRCALWQNPRTRWWTVPYAAVFLIMLFRVVYERLHGASFTGIGGVLGLIENILIYLAPLVLIPAGASLLRNRVFQFTVALHAAAGGLFSLVAILSSGLSSRVDYSIMDAGLNLSAGLSTYAVPLAILLVPKLPGLLVMTVAAGTLGWLALLVTYQSRLSSVLAFVVLGLFVAGVLRERRRLGDRTSVRWQAGIVVGCLAVGSVIVYLLYADQLSTGLLALVDRWQGSDGIGMTTLEDGRYDEASVVVGQMTWLDWLMGRGFDTTWVNYGVQGAEVRTIVHVGYLHFTLVGGVGLWYLFGLAPLLAAGRCWRQAFGLDYVAVAFVIARAIELLGYGVPHFSSLWIIVCICLGAVFDCDARRRSARNSGGGQTKKADRRLPQLKTIQH